MHSTLLLTLCSGVLTPAQSILGAIQGIEVVQPDIGSSTIVGVSCALVIFLYALQPFGIHRIGSAWAPIVIVWLSFNFVCGIYNLVKHDHTVLKAFSPYFAGAYFMRNKEEGWRSLGGLLLAFTGVEAVTSSPTALDLTCLINCPAAIRRSRCF